MMIDKQNKAWRSLTFSQRTGEAPLPEPLEVGKLTAKFRNRVWFIFESDMKIYVQRRIYGDPIELFDKQEYWEECFLKYHIDILDVAHDEPEQTPSAIKNWLRNMILNEGTHAVLTLIEFFLRIESFPKKLSMDIEKCFQFAPYCIDRSGEPVCIFPTTSKEMEESVKRALTNINQSKLTGAKSHIRNSSQELNKEDYAASIRESINAVASAARQIDPNAAKDLGPALDSLERGGIIKHRALSAAFKKLYGYTSDEQGIRKPLIENKSADVGFDEAIFMYGACVSFVDYLVSKQRQLREKGG